MQDRRAEMRYENGLYIISGVELTGDEVETLSVEVFDEFNDVGRDIVKFACDKIGIRDKDARSEDDQETLKELRELSVYCEVIIKYDDSKDLYWVDWDIVRGLCDAYDDLLERKLDEFNQEESDIHGAAWAPRKAGSRRTIAKEEGKEGNGDGQVPIL